MPSPRMRRRDQPTPASRPTRKPPTGDSSVYACDLALRSALALFAVFDFFFLTHLFFFFPKALLHFLAFPFGFALTAGAEAAGTGLPSPTNVALAGAPNTGAGVC